MNSWMKAGQPATAAPEPKRDEPIRFCSRCGRFAGNRGWRPEGVWHDRVCETCGMGVLLSCDPTALKAPRASFLVVTGELRVSAVSEAAERLFGGKHSMVGTSLLEWVSSPLGEGELARRVAWSAWAFRPPAGLPLVARRRPARDLGTLSARVATCGPPRAALVVIDRPHLPQR